MRPALRLRRLRMCEHCPWIRVHEKHRLWPRRFLHLRTKIRRQLALKPHQQIMRRRAGSSKDSVDFLPRCFGDVPAPGDAASRVSTEMQREIELERSCSPRTVPGLWALQTTLDWNTRWLSGGIHRKSRSGVSVERRAQFS